jgi:hypothetical protein
VAAAVRSDQPFGFLIVKSHHSHHKELASRQIRQEASPQEVKVLDRDGPRSHLPREDRLHLDDRQSRDEVAGTWLGE